MIPSSPGKRAAHVEGDKRARIVDAAATLVHAQGFARTSLADIARGAAIPLGNLYYYFKTKEALGEALIERRALLHQAIREAWDAELGPRERIEAFIQASVDSRDSVAQSGCPVGSLCSELHKEGGPLADQATKLFDGFLKWLEAQFRALGKGAEARDLAFHVVSSLQGASLLANAYHDTRQLSRESKRLKDWVRTL